jgi:hypothetical protein
MPRAAFIRSELRAKGSDDVREHVPDLLTHREKNDNDNDRNEDQDQSVLDHSLAAFAFPSVCECHLMNPPFLVATSQESASCAGALALRGTPSGRIKPCPDEPRMKSGQLIGA